MPFTGPSDDILAIRNLIDAYSDAVMQGDADAWGALWAEDSYWSLPEFPGHEEFIGREAIVAGWKWSMELYGRPREDGGVPVMIYVATPGSIVVDGDTAKVRYYTSEIADWPGKAKESRTRGQYDDELVKVDGRWLFRKKIYKTLHVSDG